MTPQEKIKNNEFLLNLDMKDASREQKISWLCQIIKNETDKPEDQRDFDLIAECTEYLQELSEPDAEPTQEQMDRILLEIKANHPESEIAKPVAKRPRKLMRIMAVAAVLVVMLFSALTVAAKIQGYSTAWEFVLENIERIAKMQSGDSLNENGITLIKGDKSVSYSSIEELISSEGYDILYPSDLPNDVQFTKIVQQRVNEEYIMYSYIFSDSNLSISVATVESLNSEDLQSHEIFETGTGTMFYIKSFSNGTYQAIGYDGKYEYRILYNDYEFLKNITFNMKGIKK